MFQRYAIYYTAPKGPLADFGAQWLGWDLERGKEVLQPTFVELETPLAKITEAPRKYGFHATMKPPFRLAEGESFESLRNATSEICARLSSVKLDGLSVQRIGRFLALTPVGEESDLNKLAASIVREFDRFRAAAPESELARRRANGLSASQEANLVQWGYPYVLQEFHFHMTLSGKLTKSEIDDVQTLLGDAIKPHLPSPFEIRDLTLAGEAPDGRFHAIERFDLKAV